MEGIVKIDYRNDKYLLNRITLNVPLERYSLEFVTLRPDVDEIVRLADLRSSLRVESPIPEVQRDIDREELARAQVLELASLTLWDKHGVLPFWSLSFDYDGRIFGRPELRYEGPTNKGALETTKRNWNPEVFSLNRRWFGISFRGNQTGKMNEEIRNAVEKLLKKDYRVAGLTVAKNPRIPDESVETDGVLYASRGVIEIIYEKKGKELEEMVRKSMR